MSLRCTCIGLRRAARAASHFLEKHLYSLGLHSSQFGILYTVSHAGTITITNLAEYMSLDRTTLTRNLQIMERDGLVVVTCGSDRRIRKVTLTELGQQTLTDAIPLWKETEAALTRLLGEDQRRALLSLCSMISSIEQK